MAENTTFFEKTSSALRSMHKSIIDLDTAVAEELKNKKTINQNLIDIKDEIHKKAMTIDHIIETLNGALK